MGSPGMMFDEFAITESPSDRRTTFILKYHDEGVGSCKVGGKLIASRLLAASPGNAPATFCHGGCHEGPGTHTRTGSGGPAFGGADRPEDERGGTADGAAAGFQAGSPTVGGHGIRDTRARSQDRSLRHRDRCEPAEKRGYPGSSMTCVHCGDSARFVEHRDKDIISLVGTVR